MSLMLLALALGLGIAAVVVVAPILRSPPSGRHPGPDPRTHGDPE